MGTSHIPMVEETVDNTIIDDTYKSREPRVYNEYSPTLRNGRRFKVMEKTMKIKNATKQGFIEAEDGDSVNLSYPDSKTRRGRVQKQISGTLQCGDSMGVVESFIVASRGRNPDNPSDRKAGTPLQQRLEPNEHGICNTLTSVQKDNYVVEPSIIREKPLEREGWHDYAKEVLNTEGISRTLSTQSNNLATKIKKPVSLRIRKLTPKECWRLMGFTDREFEEAQKVNSDTQLYKQAGNSIVVNVLYAIFSNLFAEERSEWLDNLLETDEEVS